MSSLWEHMDCHIINQSFQLPVACLHVRVAHAVFLRSCEEDRAVQVLQRGHEEVHPAFRTFAQGLGVHLKDVLPITAKTPLVEAPCRLISHGCLPLCQQAWDKAIVQAEPIKGICYDRADPPWHQEGGVQGHPGPSARTDQRYLIKGEMLNQGLDLTGFVDSQAGGEAVQPVRQAMAQEVDEEATEVFLV